jgi:hypothetical protein
VIYRPYRPSDLPRVAELHEQRGFAYPLPPLGGPSFAFGVVGEENGRVEQVAFLTLVPEAYLLMNEGFGTPKEQWEGLQGLHEAVRMLGIRRGFHCAYCWIPPELAAPCKKKLTRWQRLCRAWNTFQETEADGTQKPFVRRLKKLGWIGPDDWPHFTFNLK